jgi:hypothetical protein
VVLLDFWAYFGINCLHVLPELRRLEDKYPTTWRSRYNTRTRRPRGEMFRREVQDARRPLD